VRPASGLCLGPGVAGVTQLAALDAHECELWSSEVLRLRPHWTRRHQALPFFTLGLAAYLDFARTSSGPGLYRSPELRTHYNGLLRRHFGALLELSREVLSTHTGLDARFAPERSSLPGFHVHMPHPVFAGGVASVHRDLQFRDVFPDIPATARDVLTFTLPLSLPAGSGLKLWSGHEEHFRAYRQGWMLVHDGLATHQAVLHPDGEDKPRIMLQGHGLRQDDTLILYW
jgi:hypothetical protein